MAPDHQIWRAWANTLHRWGVEGPAAALLEGLGPLALVGAQLVYLSEPVLSFLIAPAQLRELARMLEDPGRTHSFAALLRDRPERA